MPNAIDCLYRLMRKTAKEQASRGGANFLRGDIRIGFRPHNEIYKGVVCGEGIPSDDNETTLSSFTIEFDCDKASWKIAYRQLRLIFSWYMDEIEEARAYHENKTTAKRLSEIRSTVARIELQEVRKRQNELLPQMQYLINQVSALKKIIGGNHE